MSYEWEVWVWVVLGWNSLWGATNNHTGEIFFCRQVSQVTLAKSRERVKQAINRRLFMDEDDDVEEATLCETLRDDQAGVDAIDIFLGVDLTDSVERQVNKSNKTEPKIQT